MPRTVRGEIAAEQRLGTPVPFTIEDESHEAQAAMFRMFPYLITKHRVLARAHGYVIEPTDPEVA